MDFTFSDDQQAITELAAQILGDKITHTSARSRIGRRDDGRSRRVERFAADAWAELAKADLLGIGLPTDVGGGGYGVMGAALVLTEIGRTAAPVPYLASIVAGAMAVADFGTAAQRSAPAGRCDRRPALPDRGPGRTRRGPGPRGARHHGHAHRWRPTAGDGWRLDGTKSFVPWVSRVLDGDSPEARGRVLVPATTPDGSVDRGAGGSGRRRGDGGRSRPDRRLARVRSGARRRDGLGRADVLAGDGRVITASIVDRVTAGLCATQAGVSAAALRLTATYTTERHQFGSPIATFQAVAQRAADAYIDTQGIQFTAWQAAWRLDQGLDAADELDIAKFWAAEAGSRVADAAQHLHGGIGVDTDYPLHRYYRLAKHLELTLGGRTERLRRLGARMAAS